MAQKERVRYYDSIKLLAAFLVYTTHFFTSYDDRFFYPWNNLPFSIILNGMTGKFGVDVFAIILGIFAYKAGVNKKNVSVFSYALQRYFYFVICGFSVNTVLKLIEIKQTGTVSLSGIRELITVSLMIKADIFPTFWVMRAFLIGSVLAFMVGHYGFDTKTKIAIILICFVSGNLWVSVCVMGTLMPEVMDNREKWNSWWKKLVLFIIALIIIKLFQSELKYFVDGIAAFILVMITEETKSVQKVLNNRLMSYFGKNAMAIFIIHPVMYSHIAPRLFGLFEGRISYTMGFMLNWLICFFIIMMVAIPVNKILDGSMRLINKNLLSKIG